MDGRPPQNIDTVTRHALYAITNEMDESYIYKLPDLLRVRYVDIFYLKSLFYVNMIQNSKI